MQRTHWPPTSKYPIKIKNILDCSQTQFWYCPSAFPAEKSAISPVNGLIKQRIIYLFRGREPLSMEKSIFHHHKLDVWRESRLQTFSVCLISCPLIQNIFFHWFMKVFYFVSLQTWWGVYLHGAVSTSRSERRLFRGENANTLNQWHFIFHLQTDTGSVCVCSEGYSKGLVHGPGVRWDMKNILPLKYTFIINIGLPLATWGRCVTSRGLRVTWRMWPLWPASGWASASWLSSSGSHSDCSPRPGMWSQGNYLWLHYRCGLY